MSIANDFQDYKMELELIIKQNPEEAELYSIAMAILRERKSSKHLSIRDVHLLRQTYNHQMQKERMYQTDDKNYGATDLLIMDRNYRYDASNNEKYIYGAVEIKALGLSLDAEMAKKTQVQKTLETFHKLLYTNGLEWRFYDDQKSTVSTVILGTYHYVDKRVSPQDHIEWNEENWDILLNMLDEIIWK